MMRGAGLAPFVLQAIGLLAVVGANPVEYGVHDYDYVVVGGGTAGIAVATRLAEKSLKVALVEAGGLYELESLQAVPGTDILSVGSDPNTKAPVDWGFVSEKNPASNMRPIHYARGKCLGGSSAMNYMIYQRPTIASMHQWATAVNDSSYEFDEALPYYKRSVHFTPPNEAARAENASTSYSADAYDGAGGPLQVSFPDYTMPFSSWMEVGMHAIGIKEANDFTMGSLSGAQYCATTIDPNEKLRSSSESSFLAAGDPSTLNIYSNALAKKVILDSNKKATGVQVQGPLGVQFTLSAKKEVIVSAGAFQSPQLLMVSGIGPADVLKEHAIDVLVDLPGVGQNMWDHPFVAPTYRVRVQSFSEIASNILYLAEQFLKFAALRKGPLTNPVSDFLGWEKLPSTIRSKLSARTREDLSKFPDDWPEIEYISGSGYIGDASNLFLEQPKDGYQYSSILGVLVTPTSRGNVTLKSADTSDLPIINPNWLETDTDQEMAIAMFKRMRAAFQSDAMAPVIIGDEYYPGNEVQTDEEIWEYIKNNVMTLWHAAGTCKMGTSDDPMAVVDNRARVFGVSGLRVVDASSFPFLPPGHPQSTVYMLAEKIAEDIINALAG